MHGESRLFDSDGFIRDRICNSKTTKGKDTSEFLKIMKEQFFSQFGHKKYVIFVHSHLIPCTEPQHLCSRVLAEYFMENNDQLIVSYHNDYHTTETNKALKIMTDPINSDIHLLCINPFAFSKPLLPIPMYWRNDSHNLVLEANIVGPNVPFEGRMTGPQFVLCGKMVVRNAAMERSQTGNEEMVRKQIHGDILVISG